jgi:hypothetical protein
MENLIKQALNDAIVKLDKITPTTKKVVKSLSIVDVSPLDIVSFMKKNDIPDDAYFDGRDNGYDGFDDILLSWEVKVPTTDKDKTDFRRKRFTTLAFARVREILLENGYKRVRYNSGLLREFKDTCVYDMFVNNQFDRLVKYYSLPFKKD